MAQSISLHSSASAVRLLLGFIAGFIATLVFHQIGLLLLHFAGLTPNLPYNMHPVPPFHVPQFVSLAFWGGVWGIVFVLIEPVIARSPGGCWVGAIVFGAVFPTLVAWFVVLPLKGLPGRPRLSLPRPVGRADRQWAVGPWDRGIAAADSRTAETRLTASGSRR